MSATTAHEGVLWTSHKSTHKEWLKYAPINADVVQISELRNSAHIRPDAWGEASKQPLLISIKLHLRLPFTQTAKTDDLNRGTIDYSLLSTKIQEIPRSPREGSTEAWSLDSYAKRAIEIALGTTGYIEVAEIEITLPKASLTGDGLRGYYHAFNIELCGSQSQYFLYSRLRLMRCQVNAIIGINANEREAKQRVAVDISIDDCHDPDAGPKMEKIATQTIEQSTCRTLEYLVGLVADTITRDFIRGSSTILRIKIVKPVAVKGAKEVGVSVVRNTNINEEYGRRIWNEGGQDKVHEM